MHADHSTPRSASLVVERLDERVPALLHPEWALRFPWLVQGTTTRGVDVPPFDLGLFASGSPGHVVHANWNHLLGVTGMHGAAHARQVHEAEVRLHRSMWGGLTVVEPCDGHATDQSGVLLAVTVADCVPVFVVAEERRAVAVLHAGWRGAAAGVLEAGIAALVQGLGAETGDLHVHLGPSICGACYEVGPEVFEALGLPAPAAPTPIDLRAILAERTEAVGIGADRITISTHCTRCTASGLFSHRGGDGQRQVGYMGLRA